MDDSLYEHPAFYEMLFGERRSDLSFYRSLADSADGPVLELGAGSGRVTLALAREGHRVVAVERSAAMVKAFVERLALEPEVVRRRVRCHQNEAERFSCGERFALVLCPFNTLAHFHDLEALSGLLRGVRASLRPRGRFAFDVLAPDPAWLREGRGDGAYVPWFRDPLSGEASRYEQVTSYDASTRVLTVAGEVRSMEREVEPVTLTLRLRIFEPGELRAILGAEGFVVEREEALGDVIAAVSRLARG